MDVRVLILAAGLGRRFYASGAATHKLRSHLAGKPVLEHVVQAVQAARLPYHIVTPAGDATCGMGDSIASGVRATSSASGWLILPGDMPLIRPSTLRAIASALAREQHCHAIVPQFHGRLGHPVAFAAPCLAALQNLTGEHGARAIVQGLDAEAKLMRLTVDDPGILFDIDTCDDLQRAEALLSSTSLMD